MGGEIGNVWVETAHYQSVKEVYFPNESQQTNTPADLLQHPRLCYNRECVMIVTAPDTCHLRLGVE